MALDLPQRQEKHVELQPVEGDHGLHASRGCQLVEWPKGMFSPEVCALLVPRVGQV